ncbi:MAG: hypothetical protein KBT75_17465 [Oleispira antarctica]|uniref:Uncharacterized protein n=1 Tax=Oleispira antarctica RB-8 TaxID=698738 RepID=R4YTM1_OLEAN|nr:hypothetical protein [Oleispira antarctica]CCK75909.1 hypothetical protein OLEAN_C17330 [Oleispira antarctica RB-8]
MSRKTLRCNIQSRNNSLKLRQTQLALASRQSRKALNRCNPYLIIGVGLLAGVTIKTIGWRKVYSFARVGARIYPLIINKADSYEDRFLSDKMDT